MNKNMTTYLIRYWFTISQIWCRSDTFHNCSMRLRSGQFSGKKFMFLKSFHATSAMRQATFVLLKDATFIVENSVNMKGYTWSSRILTQVVNDSLLFTWQEQNVAQTIKLPPSHACFLKVHPGAILVINTHTHTMLSTVIRRKQDSANQVNFFHWYTMPIEDTSSD